MYFFSRVFSSSFFNLVFMLLLFFLSVVSCDRASEWRQNDE